MAAEGEIVNGCLLTTEIVDTDLQTSEHEQWELIYLREEDFSYLGVGYTTVVPRLGVGLVLTVAVATRGTATHCVRFFLQKKKNLRQ